VGIGLLLPLDFLSSVVQVGAAAFAWRCPARMLLYKLIYLGICVVVEFAQLKAAILKLLREDEEFRYAVAGLIGMEEVLRRLDRHEEELVKIWGELARLREDMNRGFQRHDQLFAEVFKRFEHYDQLFAEVFKRFEKYDQLFAEILKKLEQHNQLFAEILKRLEQHDQLFAEIFKRFEHYDQLFAEVFKRLDRHEERIGRVEEELVKLREDMNKGFQRYDQLFAEVFKRLDRHEEELVKLRADMNMGFDRLQRRLDALGARWGIMSEKAFRDGLRGVVEKELGLRVERWTTYDGEGRVFGYEAVVEVDVAVKDGKVILIEITSHARASDVILFKRKADLYAEKEGKRPDRLIIITPYAEEDAKKAAERLGVEIYTGGE